tara:strand:+ start:928 stop:2043 length:1116 start_codon:yes stop_codon:yes gene_type:complete
MIKMKLYINNKPYDGFTNITFNKSFINLVSTFSAILPIDKPYSEYLKSNNVQKYPIIIGASAKIYIKGKIVFNGYIEKLSIKQKESQVMKISGRSITADIIDTTINKDIITRFSNNTTLKQICERVLKNIGLNIKVLESIDTGKFSKYDFIAPQVGQSLFDFLNQYAKKKQVFIQTQGDGSIKLLRSNNAIDTGSQLLLESNGKNNNVLESDTSYDISRLFNKYICHAQTQLTFAVNDTGIQGESIDSSIRKSRISNFISDTNLNTGEAINRSKWQSNFNKSQFMIYTCKVPHLTYDNENVWDTNQLVHVIDTYADINSKLLISDIKFIEDSESGIVAELTMVMKDSFNLISVEEQRKQLEKQVGQTLANV